MSTEISVSTKQRVSELARRFSRVITLLDESLAASLISATVYFPDEVCEDFPIIEAELFRPHDQDVSRIAELLHLYRAATSAFEDGESTRSLMKERKNLAIFK